MLLVRRALSATSGVVSGTRAADCGGPAVSTTITSIPAELIELPQWVLWKHAERHGKPTKIPFQVDGIEAKSNDSTTWTTSENAVDASNSYEGVGFMFSESDEFCGIDLDGCREPETGTVLEWASTWIDHFNSYTEVSPSQTGVKIFVTSKNPLAKGKNLKLDEPAVSSKSLGVEIYDKLRYFVVTGERLPGYRATCEPRQEVIDRFCRHVWPKLSETPKPARKPTRTRGARLSVEDRAARYLAKIPGAIDGSGGHNATYHAACLHACSKSRRSHHENAIVEQRSVRSRRSSCDDSP
jgi:hypothetical protein